MKKACLTAVAILLLCVVAFSQDASVVRLYGAKLVNDSLNVAQASRTAFSATKKGGVNTAELLEAGTPQKKVLLLTKKNKPVELYFFPGLSKKKALVIGGVHGSELSSIEVANSLIKRLSNGEKPFYNVVIVPTLFPDNAQAAANDDDDRILRNTGRYSSESGVDPNRQMPFMGTPYSEERPFDGLSRKIEPENRALLDLIQAFLPDRVVSIHGIRDPSKGGVFADPRTACDGTALGFDSDEQLALAMASYIQSAGGVCAGNKLGTKPTALYYLDPPIAAAGQKQARSFQVPLLQGKNRGVTLGTWCSTAVCTQDKLLNRPAIRTITIEFPGYKTPEEFPLKEDQEARAKLIETYAASIHYYFLYSYFVEDDIF